MRRPGQTPKHGARRLAARLVLLVVLDSGRLSAQNSPPAEPAADHSQQTAMEIQADVVVDALLDELRNQLVEEGRMLQRILDEPGQHRRRAESQVVLRDWARGELETLFERRIREIHQRINRDWEREVIGLDWLLGRAEIRRPGVKETAKNEALQKFEAVFGRARETAVARQWLDLEPWLKGFSPSAEEIERIAETGRGVDLAPLRRRLDSHLKTAQGMLWKDAEGKPVLLEENEKRLDQTLRERIGRGLFELAAQRQILDKGPVQGALAQTLANRLREKLLERVRLSGHSGYDLFPSVETAIPRRAAELAQRRLEEALSAGRVCPELPVDRLREWITADLVRHQEAKASLQILLAEAPGRIRENLVRRLLEREEEAPEQAAGLIGQLEQDRLAGILAGSVEACLGTSLGPARNVIAREQLLRDFPELGEDRPLPEKVIVAFRDAPDGKAPEEMVREAGLGSVGEPLLAEAREKIARLLEDGSQALHQQTGFADRVRGTIERLRANGETRDFLLREARSQVLGLWRVQGRMNRVYRELFKFTETRLEEIIDNTFKQTPEPVKTNKPEVVVPNPKTPDPIVRDELRPRETPEDAAPQERPSATPQPPRGTAREKPRKRGFLAEKLDHLRKAFFEKEDSLSAEKRRAAERLMEQLQQLLADGDPELLARLTAAGELGRIAGPGKEPGGPNDGPGGPGGLGGPGAGPGRGPGGLGDGDPGGLDGPGAGAGEESGGPGGGAGGDGGPGGPGGGEGKGSDSGGGAGGSGGTEGSGGTSGGTGGGAGGSGGGGAGGAGGAGGSGGGLGASTESCRSLVEELEKELLRCREGSARPPGS